MPSRCWDGYIHFFLCLAIDRVCFTSQLLHLWCKCHLLPIEQKDGQALASVWMHWRRKQSVPLPKDEMTQQNWPGLLDGWSVWLTRLLARLARMHGLARPADPGGPACWPDSPGLLALLAGWLARLIVPAAPTGWPRWPGLLDRLAWPAGTTVPNVWPSWPGLLARMAEPG